MDVTGQSRHPVVTQRARPSPLRTPSTPLSTPTSITSSSCRTVPNRRKGSSRTSRRNSKRTPSSRKTSESWRERSGSPRSSCSPTVSRSRQSAPARKSVVDVTNNGDPTSSSATTWKTTRTLTPRSRERSSATGSIRRSRRRATPTPTSSTSALRRAACQCGEEPKLQVGQVSGRH